MITSDWIATFALIVSALSIVLAFWLDHLRSKSLERDELRRRKIEIIHELMASRYVLSAEYPTSSLEARDFNRALALFSVYFAEEHAKEYDKFKQFKTDENLVSLLIAAASSAGAQVLDSTIRNVVTVPPRLQVVHFESAPAKSN